MAPRISREKIITSITISSTLFISEDNPVDASDTEGLRKLEILEIKSFTFARNYRPTNAPEAEVIKKYIDEHLEKGFIRSSSSPTAALILVVRKPGGGLRVCIDYRALNEIIIKN
jgi:hypothetical protein